MLKITSYDWILLLFWGILKSTYLYHGSIKYIYLDYPPKRCEFFSLHLFSHCFSFSVRVLHHCIPNPFHSVTRHQNSFFASTLHMLGYGRGDPKGIENNHTQQDFPVYDPFNFRFTLCVPVQELFVFQSYYQVTRCVVIAIVTTTAQRAIAEVINTGLKQSW